MCGIAGLFDLKGRREPDRARLLRMTTLLHHRGPDGDGLFTHPGVGLGHRRLAIIDLEGGHQPLFNEDGSAAVVFNGEIYNFQELVPQLEALGHRFRTRCDTEVIIHAWEAWGEACVDRLQGMFAFAIWDRDRKTLFLARDRLGIKPCYYAFLDHGWFAFASELKGVLAGTERTPPLDPRAVSAYFTFGYVPDPLTIFQGMHKLPPGHGLLLTRNQPPPPPRRYWDLSFQTGPTLSVAAAGEALRHHLKQAVQSHMIADVPLGTFLSGGVDSSAVTALAATLSQKPLSACTVSFSEAGFDESTHAIRVAQRYGLNHQLEQANADHFDLIDTLAYHYDEPFADNSALPTWLVCQLARKRVKVALSGDGGDELLAGYERYRFFMAEETLRAWLPQPLRAAIFAPLGQLYPKADWAPRFLRAKSTFQSLARDSVAGYCHAVSILTEPERNRLFSAALHRDLQGFRSEQILRDLLPQAPDHPLSRIQYLDLKTFLAGRVLTKVDRASMAHGLEVRVPLLDHRFVEWSATLPPELKLHQGEGKYLLKQALKPLLPDEILFRPKMGFNTPLADWLRGPLRERTRSAVLGERLATTGFFQPRQLHRLVNQHQSGGRDFGTPLWALIMFDAFLGKVMGVANAGENVTVHPPPWGGGGGGGGGLGGGSPPPQKRRGGGERLRENQS